MRVSYFDSLCSESGYKTPYAEEFTADSRLATDQEPTAVSTQGLVQEGDQLDTLSTFRNSLSAYQLLSDEQEQRITQLMYQHRWSMIEALLSWHDSAEPLMAIISELAQRRYSKPLWLSTEEHYVLKRELNHLSEQIASANKLQWAIDWIRETLSSTNHAPITLSKSVKTILCSVDWPAPLIIALSRRQLPAFIERSQLDRALEVYLAHIYGMAPAAAASRCAQSQQALLKEAIRAYYSNRNVMVKHNLRLVYHIAKRYCDEQGALLDTIQAGVIGLIRAAEKFSQDRGCRFSTYAYYWIEAKIRLVYDSSQTVMRLPTSVEAELTALHQHREALRLEGQSAIRQQLCKRLGKDQQRVDNLLAINNRALSLDQPLRDSEKSLTLNEVVADQTPDPLMSAANRELSQQIQRLLTTLSPRQRYIVINRYGLGNMESQSLESISQGLNLSRERVRQLEREALGILRCELDSCALGDGLKSYLE